MAVKRVRLYPVDCWLCWGCVVINGMFFVLKGGTATSVCMYVCMYVCVCAGYLYPTHRRNPRNNAQYRSCRTDKM